MGSLVKDAALGTVVLALVLTPIVLVAVLATATWEVVFFLPAFFVSMVILLGFKDYLDRQEVK